MVAERLDAEYVLPIRRSSAPVDPELAAYLRDLATWIDVTIVDGSDAAAFQALRAALAGTGVRHLPPTQQGRNGKASGAVSGILAARHERIVLADDDIRYDAGALAASCAALADADFVRLQNVYRPAPWWAQWDTGRILLNRAFGGDYGGTVAVRRTAVAAAGGYRTDVLFENLELERTIAAAGGRVRIARELLVTRRPPTFRHFLGQRVRQAYDDFAQPARLGAELAVLPLSGWLVRRRAWRALAAALVALVAVAEVGRRSAGGARHFLPTASLWAPAWLAERAVTVWLALIARARGGVRYHDHRLRDAASSPSALRAAAATPTPTGARA